MNKIDARGLFRVQERITNFQARSWSGKISIIRIVLLGLTLLVAVKLLKAATILVYLPAILMARMFNIQFPYSHAMGANFGHLASDPNWHMKAQLVGARPTRRAILVISRNRVTNRYLLEMWHSKYFVVDHPVLVALLSPFQWTRLTATPIYLLHYKVKLDSGEVLEHGPALDEIGRRYEKLNAGKPMFEIDEDFRDRGQRALQDLGIPPDSWWAVLHVRERGTNEPLDPRNSDPLSYMKAAQAIIDRGGYVIRIGNPTMTPLLKMDGIVDYAHSSAKADWLDIFIIGASRFLLACFSGPNDVAQLFRVPVAIANGVPISQGSLGHDDIRIAKLLLDGSSGKPLSFETSLGSDQLRDLHSESAFIEAGIAYQDNSEEEIRELVTEMMDRIEGVASYDDRDEQLQSRFQELVLSQPTLETWGTESRIGRHFLRTYADLFTDENLPPQN